MDSKHYIDITESNKRILKTSRPIFTQYKFDLEHCPDYDGQMKKKTLENKIDDMKIKYCTKKKLKNLFLSKFPCILLLLNYKWKTWILADFIAGLIVGIMHIPQGMAYAQLAGLRSVYGLYVSVFPSLIYFFLGTSRHISIGTMAIASLMTGQFLQSSMNDITLGFEYNSILNSSKDDMKNLHMLMAKKAAGFSLCVGITQFLMGLLNIGFLTKFLADPVISGFTVGASVHVLISQLKYCFGLDIPSYHGAFYLLNTIHEIVVKLPDINIPTFILTLVSIFILIISKEVLNSYFMDKLKFPVPMELFIMISSIFATKYLFLNEKFNVKIVGEISRGLPAPTIPDIDNFHQHLDDIFITAIITSVVSISLAKIFSKKHTYKIDSNQEFFAYGMMNIFGSFFLCYPSSGSISRSTVFESVGGKTQLTAIVSSCLVILALLFIGPLFKFLPTCILASIIIVSLKGMFIQFSELKELWDFSIWEFSIWIATLFSTILLDVEYGLIIGISYSILSVILRITYPHSGIMGQVPETDIYQDISLYNTCSEIPGIKIFQYEGYLFYASCEHFRKLLYSKVNCNPGKIRFLTLQIKKKLSKIQKKFKTNCDNVPLITNEANLKNQLGKIYQSQRFKLIIDCSTWGYMDISGLKTLNQVVEEFNSISVPVSLANLNVNIRQMLYKIQPHCLINDKIIYLTVHDAVISCLDSKETNEKMDIED